MLLLWAKPHELFHLSSACPNQVYDLSITENTVLFSEADGREEVEPKQLH